MAFSWTSTAVGVGLAAAQINEVQTNVNTLTDALGVARFSWSELPVSTGDPIENAQFQEMRDAADYTHNNNVCAAEYSSHNSVVDTTDRTTHYSDHDSGVDSAYYSSDYNSHYTSDNSSHDSTNNGGNHYYNCT